MSDRKQAAVQPGGGRVAAAIRAKLEAGLSPISLEIVDELQKHAGHAHVAERPGRAGASGETHFRIKVVCEAFKGKSRIERHRAINALLAPELAGGVHALSIDARAPAE